MFGSQAGNLRHPLGPFPPLGLRDERLQYGFGIAHQRHFHGDDPPHLRRFNVQVDDAGVRRKAGNAPRYPVVKAHPQPNQHIGLVNHHIAPVHTMHPQHTQALGVVAGEGAQPQQSVDDGDAGALGQLPQFGVGAGVDDAVSGDDDGAFRIVNQLGGLADVIGQVGRQFGRQRRRRRYGPVGVGEFGFLQLHIPGDINQHRPGAPFLGHAESLADGARQVVGGKRQVGALGAYGGDGTDVAFLEGFGAHSGARHLPGDGNQGDAVGLGRHNAGDEVGGAGAGGGNADAGLAGDAGVAVGGVGGGLLVPHQDVAQAGVGPQGVIKGQDGAAGVSEQHFYSLAQQAFADDFRAFEFHG